MNKCKNKCKWCWNTYDKNKSNANDKDYFCSINCEQDARSEILLHSRE